MNMPYYIRLDATGNIVRNAWSSGYVYYGYLTNSIFIGNYSGMNASDNWRHLTTGLWESSAADSNVRNKFYMSVRCVRDTPLRDDERK